MKCPKWGGLLNQNEPKNKKPKIIKNNQKIKTQNQKIPKIIQINKNKI